MKAQVALEYLIIVSLGIILIIPIFYYALTQSSESILISQAQDTVNSVAKTADYVDSLGSGSSSKIVAIIPSNVINSSIQNKTILLRIRTSSGDTDVIAFTKTNVNGTLPTASGYYAIFFNMTGQGVQIKT